MTTKAEYKALTKACDKMVNRLTNASMAEHHVRLSILIHFPSVVANHEEVRQGLPIEFKSLDQYLGK